MKFKLIGILIIVLLGIGFYFFNSKKTTESINIQTDTLSIVSTKPEPLENATILPTDSITLTFNKAFELERVKFRVEPEVELNIKASSENTVIVSFKKPLQLGSGYTLFISPDVASKTPIKLDKEYGYHFKTIGYRGV